MIPVVTALGIVNLAYRGSVGLGMHSQVLEPTVVVERVYCLARAHFSSGWEVRLEGCPFWHCIGGRRQRNRAGTVGLVIITAILFK